MIKRVGLASMIALPVIASIIAPRAVTAQSMEGSCHRALLHPRAIRDCPVGRVFLEIVLAHRYVALEVVFKDQGLDCFVIVRLVVIPKALSVAAVW